MIFEEQIFSTLGIKNFKPIGSGSFSEVFIGDHILTNEKIAIKVISKNTTINSKKSFNLKREIHLMKKIDHPFIIHYYKILTNEKYLYLLMEYVSNGNLLNFINQNGPLKENEAKKIFCQLLSTLRYLHEEMFIIHRDLKMENLLLTSNFDLRLIDFGLSTEIIQSDGLFSTFCGSLPYLSPEVILKESYSSSIDLWSAGIILYTIVVGRLPFFHNNLNILIQLILDTNPEFPSNLSLELIDLLKNLLNKDKNKRISAAEASLHPWIKSSNYFNFTSDLFLLDNRFKLIPKDINFIDNNIFLNLKSKFSYSEFLNKFKDENELEIFLYKIFKTKKLLNLPFEILNQNSFLPPLKCFKKQSESYCHKNISYTALNLLNNNNIENFNRKRIKLRRSSFFSTNRFEV